MPMAAQVAPIVRDAEAVARRLLAEDSDRLAHCHYAAGIAERAAAAFGVAAADELVAAAWLHDIGHSRRIARTGFHPLDGALHLAAEGWPDDVVLLVAHHSHAAILAPYFGVEHQLAVLDRVDGDAEDILTYADLCSGPTGMGVFPEGRATRNQYRPVASARIPKDIAETRYRLLQSAASRIGSLLVRQPDGWSGQRQRRVPAPSDRAEAVPMASSRIRGGWRVSEGSHHQGRDHQEALGVGRHRTPALEGEPGLATEAEKGWSDLPQT